MRVVFCAYDRENYVGGPNAWLRRLLPDLRRRGIDAQCYMMTLSPPDLCPSLQALQEAGVPCHHTRYHDFVEERIHWLLACARRNQPDVFVPNLVPAAYHAGRWLRQAGIPTVGVLHSDDRFYQDISRVFAFGRDVDRVDAMVCVSKLLEGTLQGSGVDDVVHIGPSIGMPDALVDRQSGTFRLMYAGRLVEKQKRISRVAKMFCLAAQTFPDVECVIYGHGPDHEQAKQVVSSMNADGRVKLAGRVDSDKMVLEMARNHVAVLLSEYEGLPLSLLEAMGQGLVPLCSKICDSGIPEVITHDWNGLLIGEDEQDFLDAVARLKQDKAFFSKLSTNARASVENTYSMEKTTSQWCALFERVVSKKAKSTAVRLPLRLRLPVDGVHTEDDRGGVKASLKGCVSSLMNGVFRSASI